VLPALYDLVEGSRERRRVKRAEKRAELEHASASAPGQADDAASVGPPA